LKPADQGVFDIVLDGKLVFSRKQVGRFPTFDEVKREIDPKLTVQLST
jgi:selT/selW/selH-like putative selenoprotein